jgi:hypothetical protein
LNNRKRKKEEKRCLSRSIYQEYSVENKKELENKNRDNPRKEIYLSIYPYQKKEFNEMKENMKKDDFDKRRDGFL